MTEASLGPGLVNRFRLPGPQRPRPPRVGSVATGATRFAAGTVRPVAVRRALASPTPIRPARAGEQVRPPRWWSMHRLFDDPAADLDTTPMPPRGLRRAVRSRLTDSPAPGTLATDMTATTLPVRRHPDAAAAGPMLMEHDRQRRAPQRPSATTSVAAGVPPGKLPGGSTARPASPAAPPSVPIRRATTDTDTTDSTGHRPSRPTVRTSAPARAPRLAQLRAVVAHRVAQVRGTAATPASRPRPRDITAPAGRMPAAVSSQPSQPLPESLQRQQPTSPEQRIPQSGPADQPMISAPAPLPLVTGAAPAGQDPRHAPAGTQPAGSVEGSGPSVRAGMPVVRRLPRVTRAAESVRAVVARRALRVRPPAAAPGADAVHAHADTTRTPHVAATQPPRSAPTPVVGAARPQPAMPSDQRRARPTPDADQPQPPIAPSAPSARTAASAPSPAPSPPATAGRPTVAAPQRDMTPARLDLTPARSAGDNTTTHQHVEVVHRSVRAAAANAERTALPLASLSGVTSSADEPDSTALELRSVGASPRGRPSAALPRALSAVAPLRPLGAAANAVTTSSGEIRPAPIRRVVRAPSVAAASAGRGNPATPSLRAPAGRRPANTAPGTAAHTAPGTAPNTAADTAVDTATFARPGRAITGPAPYAATPAGRATQAVAAADGAPTAAPAELPRSDVTAVRSRVSRRTWGDAPSASTSPRVASVVAPALIAASTAPHAQRAVLRSVSAPQDARVASVAGLPPLSTGVARRSVRATAGRHDAPDPAQTRPRTRPQTQAGGGAGTGPQWTPPASGGHVPSLPTTVEAVASGGFDMPVRRLAVAPPRGAGRAMPAGSDAVRSAVGRDPTAPAVRRSLVERTARLFANSGNSAEHSHVGDNASNLSSMAAAGFSAQPIVRRLNAASSSESVAAPTGGSDVLDDDVRHARLHEEMDLERDAELVERVVEALEQRVIDELERRGLWRTPGVF
jgi:hypothetical protein